MLSRLVLDIKVIDGKPLHYNAGTLFHGWLMDRLPTEKANVLHDQNMKPYSQWVLGGESENIWVINTLNQELKEWIIDPFLESENRRMTLTKTEQKIEYKIREIKQITYAQLVEKYVLAEQKRRAKLKFCTPGAFKIQGQYVNFPVMRNVFMSLSKRFDMYSTDLKLESEISPEVIDTYVKIVEYRLRSTKYHLEGIRIPSFLGEVSLLHTGPKPMVNLLHMLYRFGEFSGIGMKTALGMGGLKVVEGKE